jgi:hypothetical protein
MLFEGVTKHTSARFFTFPPLKPVNTIVFDLTFFAYFNASIIFAELPLPVKAIARLTENLGDDFL